MSLTPAGVDIIIPHPPSLIRLNKQAITLWMTMTIFCLNLRKWNYWARGKSRCWRNHITYRPLFWPQWRCWSWCGGVMVLLEAGHCQVVTMTLALPPLCGVTRLLARRWAWKCVLLFLLPHRTRGWWPDLDNQQPPSSYTVWRVENCKRSVKLLLTRNCSLYLHPASWCRIWTEEKLYQVTCPSSPTQQHTSA